MKSRLHPRKLKRLAALILLINLAGIFFSYILLEEFHFSGISEAAGEKVGAFSEISRQLCGEKESFLNCGAAAASEYSRIFGLPTAAYGLFFFIVNACALIFAFFVKGERQPLCLTSLFWITAAGAAFDVAMLVVSIFFIKALCPLCSITWIACWVSLILLIVVALKGNFNPMRFLAEIRELRKDVFKYLLICLATIVFAGGCSYATHSVMDASRREHLLEYVWKAFSGEKEFNIDYSRMASLGNPDAPVTMAEFSDFLCPFCAEASKIIDELLEENPDELRVVFSNYPLDAKCNYFIRGSVHPGACVLAKGALCADEQNGFDSYHRMVFAEKPEKPDKEKMKEIAGFCGLDVARFEKCMASPSTEAKLQVQIVQSALLDSNKTPTIFINGREYKFKIDRELLQMVIDREAEQKKSR